MTGPVSIAAPPLHPDLRALAFLVGTWTGEGRGLWDADPPFGYREEIVVEHSGRPFLVYRQRTWDMAGTPRHTETGYLRPVGDGGVEWLIVQPIGVAEVHAGRCEGRRLVLSATALALTPTAKRVTAVERRLEVDDSGLELRYLLRMGMNDEPAADHLAATLRRAAEPPTSGAAPAS